jgi:hypothetical protein
MKRHAALLAIGLVLGATTAAFASIPDSSGVIHACYDHHGRLRVIDSDQGQHCKPVEQALEWNAEGSSGPATTYRVAREEVALNPVVDSQTTAAVQCLAGETLISGGWETDPLRRVEMGKAQIDRDGQSFEPVSYAVTVYNTAGGTGILRVQAVCASG